MAAPIAIDANSIPVQKIYNRTAPCEGPKAGTVTLDFSATDTYTLNGLQITQQNKMCDVQGIYIDASGTDQATTITVPATGQIVKVKGRTQGWYPIVCPNPFTLQFVNTDGVVRMPVILVNVPVQAGQWSTQ